MAYHKELEIQLQFLEEAQEYLRTLESQLLGLAQAIDAEKVNEALRAAHSIKGGAGLMGFDTLSNLAHRLEDGLKVGYRARIRNHGHSCFLCEIVIRSQFHTTYEPEA
jgi:Chemotaxis protein histidine kinase and related kinases